MLLIQSAPNVVPKLSLGAVNRYSSKYPGQTKWTVNCFFAARLANAYMPAGKQQLRCAVFWRTALDALKLGFKAGVFGKHCLVLFGYVRALRRLASVASQRRQICHGLDNLAAAAAIVFGTRVHIRVRPTKPFHSFQSCVLAYISSLQVQMFQDLPALILYERQRSSGLVPLAAVPLTSGGDVLLARRR